jgi:hypothetical protein
MIAKRRGKKVNSKYLQRMAKKAGVLTQLSTITEQQAINGIKFANAMCAAYAKMHIQERDRFTESWAAAEAKALNITAEKAIWKRNLIEKQCRDARIINQALGKQGQSGVSKVLVTLPTGVHECATKEETEAAFLGESNVRFRQAGDTPALTTLLHDLGTLGITEKSDQILSGTYSPPAETDFWTAEWIKEMQRPPNFTTLPLDRSLEDYVSGWKKAKERTSSSPFGLRFANYKAHTFHEDIAEIDYKLAQIPLLTGHSPGHWQQAMNAWILKKPEEYRVEKMRTILLYDAAFNQNNKWTGRAAMSHSEGMQ